MIGTDDIKPHDWYEADEMVWKTLAGGSIFNDDFRREFHLSISQMGIRGDSFNDDKFRKMLEKVIMKTFQIKKFNQDECDPHYSVLVSDVLSKDVNDHPIDRFHEVLSCLRMHVIDDVTDMGAVWRGHELLKWNHITEYDDDGDWEWVTMRWIVRRAEDDYEAILKARLLDAVMRASSDGSTRRRLRRLSFPMWYGVPEYPEAMLAAVRAYSTEEPDYQLSLSALDDYVANHGYYFGGYDRVEIYGAFPQRFHEILGSCDGNVNAMSGLIHAAIKLGAATDDDKDLFDVTYANHGHDAFYPTALRLTLKCLAEGHPIECVREQIISKRRADCSKSFVARASSANYDHCHWRHM